MTAVRATVRIVILTYACLTAQPATAQPAFAQPVIPPFQVAVSLSALAAERLGALQESIAVSAGFFGEPTSAALNRAGRMGHIGLGGAQVVIPGQAGIASFAGQALDPAKITLIENGAVQVLINVYTARRKAPDNLLNCDVFQDSVEVAARRPIQIACKLITEGL